jgi:pseudouridine-5'-phosphate glycosidase
MSSTDLIQIDPEVREAVACGAPVVALESTVIAHGLPAPENLAVARAMEAEVRAAGAVPATIAVLDGRLRVGLDPAALERLAGGSAVKAAAGDLAAVMARGLDAATTVSATVVAAARAGIAVFATGGIGGVHKRPLGEPAAGKTAWDVSHDLVALARERVAVVCAGAKSILDLPTTLEALETLGVPVVGYGTSELPAFYVRSSGLALEHRVDDARIIGSLLRAHWRGLAQPGGVLVVNPIAEEAALSAEEMEIAYQQAAEEAARAGVRGKSLTPFLLAALARATGGRSIGANRTLLLANARLAAAIAGAFVKSP